MRQLASSDRQGLDWLLFLLLIAGVACLPLTVETIELVPEASRLLRIAIWAAVLGVFLGRARVPSWLAWTLGIVLGIEASVQFAGQFLPGPRIVLYDMGRIPSWLVQLAGTRRLPATLPLAESIAHVQGQVTAVAASFGEWLMALQTEATSEDNTALLFLSSLIVWLLSWNAGFELFRKGRTFVAMLPLGAAIISAVAFTYVGMSYVHVFLAITLLALVRSNVKRTESFWRRRNMDYSVELRRDATVAGGLLSTIIVVVALLMPYVTYNRAVFAFWEWVEPKVTGFYQDLDRAFAGRNPIPTPTAGAEGLGGHNVAAGGVLGEDTVFVVSISDPLPPPEEELEMLDLAGVDLQDMVPKRYWRERTYDVYTGSGWDTSSRNPRPVLDGERWTSQEYPAQVLTQTFRLIDKRAPFGFAVNELLSVDQPYEAILRQDGDLAAFRVSGDTYTVYSRVPEPMVEEMLAAEAPYPPWVADSYLALPKIPNKVRGTAEQIVLESGATTRYDKATAIESYLRQLEYDLELEPPPLGADIVEYFLFDAQRGYCDYSASAMVVMLRSVGVAARYASGFHMGRYDPDYEGYVVTQANSHAWAEVFFPGLGWVEFEPTPSQFVFARQSTSGAARSASQPAPAAAQSTLPPLWVWAAGLAFILLFVIVWPPRWFARKLSPQQAVEQTYARLVRRARWLGMEPLSSQTPREYLSSMLFQLNQRGQLQGLVREDIESIGGLYQQACYGNHNLTPQQAAGAEGAWRRLKGKFFWMLFTRRTPHRQQPTTA